MTKKFLGLNGYQWTCILYVAVAVFTWQLKYFRHIDNNYLIFRQSWYHARAQLNMYAAYPAEYYDFYYYGPLFALFAAPFAIPSEFTGFFLWEVGNAAVLLLAIHMLPLTQRQKTIILLLSAIEFANSIFYMQFNPMIAGMIIISFLLVEKGKDEWAAFIIVLGAMVKLYPGVGLVFILFSKQKPKFIISAILWAVVLFFAPMLISGPAYIINSYHQWLAAVSFKSNMNMGLNTTQDWCIMGVVRRFANTSDIPNLPFLLIGGILFLMPMLRFRQFTSLKFRLQMLASALIAVVIFSTGAEHPTYIIVAIGAFLYLIMQPNPFSAMYIVFIVWMLIVALSPTDVSPMPVRDWMGHYAVKAWPAILIWFKIVYELLVKDFTTDPFRFTYTKYPKPPIESPG